MSGSRASPCAITYCSVVVVADDVAATHRVLLARGVTFRATHGGMRNHGAGTAPAHATLRDGYADTRS